MVELLEHDKKLKEAKARQGHQKIVRRLKKYAIVKRVLANEENASTTGAPPSPSARLEAMRKVAKEASDIINSSESRPSLPPSPGAGGPYKSTARMSNSTFSQSPSYSKKSNDTSTDNSSSTQPNSQFIPKISKPSHTPSKALKEIVSKSEKGPHTRLAKNPTQQKPKPGNGTLHSPPHNTGTYTSEGHTQEHANNSRPHSKNSMRGSPRPTPTSSALNNNGYDDGGVDEDNIPAPAREEYLQMQRSIAHLPQLTKHKHEKQWLENWHKLNSPNPPTKRKKKGAASPPSPRTPNLSPRGLEMTPWE